MDATQDLQQQIAYIEKAGKEDLADVTKKLESLKNQKKDKNEAVFSKLRVSWEMNGNKKYVESKEDMGIDEFRQSVAGLNAAVAAKVNRDVQPKEVLPSPSQVKRAYRRRQEQRELKISHLTERLRQVQLPRAD